MNTEPKYDFEIIDEIKEALEKRDSDVNKWDEQSPAYVRFLLDKIDRQWDELAKFSEMLDEALGRGVSDGTA